jgi:hypothetical protein
LAYGNDAHIMVAYSDGKNVHIADVDLFNNNSTAAAAQTASTSDSVFASDMVVLTGISNVTALNAQHNIHLV